MDYHYEVAGKPVVLEADENLVGVRYSEFAPHSERATIAGRVGAEFEDRFEVPNEKFTILKAPGVSPAFANYADNPFGDNVARIAPVFRVGDATVLATDRVLFGLKELDEPVEQVLAGVNPTDIESRGFGEFMIRLPEGSDPLVVATRLAANPKIDYAEPDFVNISPNPSVQPADARLMRAPTVPTLSYPGRTSHKQPAMTLKLNEEHWHLQIQNAGIRLDIYGSDTPAAPVTNELVDESAAEAFDEFQSNRYAAEITGAQEAWKLQTGLPAIRIAILDEGVDKRHDDLRQAIVGEHDAADGDDFQEPNPWDGHGTACAGLAAAIPSNERGMRGIAAGCSLLAVRIAYSERPGGPWVARDNDHIRKGIDWSWMNGADILSNSWGGGAQSNAIERAFKRARTQGRGGKGCVVVIAAGNSGQPVRFPATLEGLLVVSASNEFDEFKTKSSRDGERWWGSSFGPEVGIAAPGVHNFTTDITGSSGYNRLGNYYPNFNGTSSSTPIVAGAAALLLSARPEMSEKQVRDTLCQTADKVGNKKYVNGRNDQFGYGRLNVLKAVRAAKNH